MIFNKPTAKSLSFSRELTIFEKANGFVSNPLYLHAPQPQATTPVPLPLDRNISQHEINVLNSVQYVLEVALNPPSHTQWLADRAEIIEEVKLLLANNKAQGEKP